MASTPEAPPTSSPSEQEETPAQRQARLRRERRNAKIQAGGSARLAAITSISGRQGPPPENRSLQPSPSPKPSPSPALLPIDSSPPDPDEVDISHPSFPRPSPSPQPYQPYRSAPPPPPYSQSVPPPPQPTDDPMLAMMQQMMRGMDPNAPPGGPGDLPPGLPPGFAKMFEAMNGAPQEAQQPEPSAAYLWQIVHAVFALVLAVYVAVATGFTGGKLARERGSEGVVDDFYGVVGEDAASHVGRRLFAIFATVEIALQSARYFLEKGRLPQSGLLGWLSQMLPEPYAGYARVVGRYSVIWSTVVADAMVVIFVLGAVAWWKKVTV